MSPHEEQAVSIDCLTKIGELTNTHPNLNIQLLWLPRSIPFVGFRRAKQLALEAICIAPAGAAEEPCMIKNQKQKTREKAITTWATQWHQAPCTSLAYRTALTKPPDSQAHPVFQNGQNPAKFSRKTFCTLYRIITRHAFIGSYTQQFHLQHTLEQIACSYGEPVQTVEHMLLKCPLYTTVHYKHLTANGHP